MVQSATVLVATFGDELDDLSALTLQDDVGERVVAARDGVLLDISALDIVDSFISKVLGDTAGIVRVLGAEVAIVGMRPAVAITLVELGLPLDRGRDRTRRRPRTGRLAGPRAPVPDRGGRPDE